MLRRGDLVLDAVIPFVNVRASTTKNGKSVAIRLHPDVVAALREHFHLWIVPMGALHTDREVRFFSLLILRLRYISERVELV